MNSRLKKNLISILLLLGGIALIVLVVLRSDPAKLWNDLKQADVKWLFLAGLISVGGHLIRALRWNMLLEPMGYRIHPRRSFYAVMTGYLVNLATSRGGEVVRCAVVTRTDNVPFEKSAGTVVTERVIDLVMLVLVSLLTLLFQFDVVSGFLNRFLIDPLASKMAGAGSTRIIILLISAAIAAVLFWMVLKRMANRFPILAKIKSFVAGFGEGIKSVLQLRRPGLFIAASAGIWISYLISGWMVFYALPGTSHFGFGEALSLLLFSAVGIIVPIPGNLGPLMVVSLGFQMVYGLAETQAAGFAALFYAYQVLSLLLVGAACSGLLAMETRKIESQSAAS